MLECFSIFNYFQINKYLNSNSHYELCVSGVVYSQGLEASTIKTVRHHIQNTFSVPVFSREEKDLIGVAPGSLVFL